jgi:hypothetical protein
MPTINKSQSPDQAAYLRLLQQQGVIPEEPSKPKPPEPTADDINEPWNKPGARTGLEVSPQQAAIIQREQADVMKNTEAPIVTVEAKSAETGALKPSDRVATDGGAEAVIKQMPEIPLQWYERLREPDLQAKEIAETISYLESNTANQSDALMLIEVLKNLDMLTPELKELLKVRGYDADKLRSMFPSQRALFASEIERGSPLGKLEVRQKLVDAFKNLSSEDKKTVATQYAKLKNSSLRGEKNPPADSTPEIEVAPPPEITSEPKPFAAPETLPEGLPQLAQDALRQANITPVIIDLAGANKYVVTITRPDGTSTNTVMTQSQLDELNLEVPEQLKRANAIFIAGSNPNEEEAFKAKEKLKAEYAKYDAVTELGTILGFTDELTESERESLTKEFLDRYKNNPDDPVFNLAGNGGNLTVEQKIKIAQLAGVPYDPQADIYKSYIFLPSPSSLIVSEYALKHEISESEAKNLMDLRRTDPNSNVFKTMSEEDLSSLDNLLRRNDAGGDFIGKYEYEQIKNTDPEGAKILKTLGLDGYNVHQRKISEDIIAKFESELKANDPAGWDVYLKAGKGANGEKAYHTFMEAREAIILRYSTPEKIDTEGNTMVLSSFDTMRLISDINRGVFPLEEAIKYFGPQIIGTTKEVNEAYIELPSGWYDRKTIEELSESDPDTYKLLLESEPAGESTAYDVDAVKKAVAAAELEAERETPGTSGGAETWRIYDELKAAESALTAALDKIDKDNPALSRDEKAKLYENLPELERYNKAAQAAEGNHGVIADVLAEILSPELSWDPKEWRFGTLPTLTFNRDQLSKMYEDNVKVTLAIYTNDKEKLAKLYQDGAFGEDKEQALLAYKDALAIVADQNAIKQAVNQGDTSALKDLYDKGAFGDDKESYDKLVNYVSGGGRELAPITPADIKLAKASLGSKEDYIKATASAYPSGTELLGEAALSMTPILGTIRNWDKMGSWGKAFSILTDVAILAPFAGAAARATRGITTATGAAGRLKGIGGAIGGEAKALARAPIDVIIHPVSSGKAIVRNIKNLDIFQMPKIERLPNGTIVVNESQLVTRLPDAVITTSDGVVRIRVPKDMSRADAFKAVEKMINDAAHSGNDLIVEIGGKRIEVPRSALMREIGGGFVHTSPDIEKLLKSGEVLPSPGMSAKEQGLFMSVNPALNFTSHSAFGKGTIPIASQATDTVLDVAKYRVNSLVMIDKAPVRPLDFADAANVPKDLARALQKYTRKNNGILSGSLNEYIKLIKAALPKGLDLVFANATKAIRDIMDISIKLGYKTRRAPHAIEIYRDNKWTQIADIADIKIHRAMLPDGLSQRALTRINGIRTETLGEQYLRQSLGATSGSQKAVIRAERVNKAAGEVKKMLEAAQAEMRKPGAYYETLKKPGVTGKMYHGVELETKKAVGSQLPPIKTLQHFYSRTEPLGERIEHYIKGDLTKSQILKLYAVSPVEALKSMFRSPIKITNIGRNTPPGELSAFLEEADELSDAMRRFGNQTGADVLQRAVRANQAVRRAQPMIARTVIAGGMASQAAGVKPASADDIDRVITRAYEAEAAGDIKQADKFLREAEILRNKISGERVKTPDIRKILNNPIIVTQTYRKHPLTQEEVIRITNSIPELREATSRGADARIEVARLIIGARRKSFQDLRSRQLRLLQVPRTTQARQLERLDISRINELRIPRGSPGPRTARTPRIFRGEDLLQTPRVPRISRVPRIPRVPRPPFKGQYRSKDLNDREKRQIIANADGALTWKMGSVAGRGKNGERQDRWDTIVNPYSDDEHYLAVYGRPPRGATIISRGKGSVVATAQMLYGKPPKKPFTVDSGFEDIHVNSRGNTINVRFLPDPRMETDSDITIGKRRSEPISPRAKPISTPLKPIERRITRITPVTKGISNKPRRLE